ncbi:MAG TPA: hypothetical protein VHV51_03350 [Polyangiaceae bacterium]|nr:hypothetical protein [Polyangiaceae bacterium]
MADRECSSVRAAFLLLVAVAACDPSRGITDAVNGISPNEKSYLDGPGTRLAEGAYRSVRLDYTESTSAHLVARRADDNGTSLTLFGANGLSSCSLSPNVYTWFPDLPSAEPYRLLPYIDSNDANRVLHFSNLDCQLEAFSVPNAVMIARGTTLGFLIRAGNSLEVVDPWLGTTRSVVADVKQLYTLSSNRFGVWGDAQIVILDEDFNELVRTGSNVSSAALAALATTLVFSDDEGLHSCTLDYSAGTSTLSTTCSLIATDACNLRKDTDGESTTVIVQQPCASNHVVAIGLTDPDAPEPFAASADASQTRFGSNYSNDGGAEDEILFLTDTDPQTGFGTLWAAHETGDPVRIGDNAVLDDAEFESLGADVAGVAVVDADATLGTARWVTWNWSGQIQTLAENVLYDRVYGENACANFDGHSCDDVYLTGTGMIEVEHTHSPPVDHQLVDPTLQISLRLADFNGTTGTLIQDWSAVDETIATGVAPLEYDTLDGIPLDGFGYLADWDANALTGTLYVRNQRLGSTMSIAAGVSDFFGTSYPLQGIAYAIPNGKNAGIWFTRAK